MLETLLILGCLTSDFELDDKSPEPRAWTELDEWTKNRAKYVCAVRYRGCLSKLIKYDTGRYSALCRKTTQN